MTAEPTSTSGSSSGSVRLRGRTLSRNIILGLSANIVPTVAALVAIPLLLARLGVERFGGLALLWTLLGYSGLLDLGFGRALTKRISERLPFGDWEMIRELFWTSVAIFVGLGAIMGLTMAAAVPWVSGDVLKGSESLNRELQSAFFVTAAALPIIVVGGGMRGALEAQQRFDITSAVQAFSGILTFTLPVLALFSGSPLVATAVMLTAVRGIVVAVYLVALLKLTPGLRDGFIVTRRAFRDLLSFSVWIAVSNIVNPVMVFMDRFLVGHLLSVATVAYYATPFDVISKLLLIPAATVNVLFPAFSAAYVSDREASSHLFLSGVHGLTFILLPLTVAIVGLAPTLLEFWLGSTFAQASTLVAQILAIGIFFNGIGHIPSAYLQGIGRVSTTSLLGAAEMPLYLGLLVALGTSFGVVGIAFAWSVRAFVDLIALLFFASPHVQIRTMRVNPLIMMTSVLGISFLPSWLGWGAAISFVWTVAAAGAALAGVWLILFESDDRQQWRRIAGEWLTSARTALRRSDAT